MGNRLPHFPTKLNTGFGVADAAIQTILRDARDQRQFADFLLLSDSNGGFGSYGWRAGMMRGSYNAGIPVYGTPILSANENGGSGSPYGDMVKIMSPLVGALSGAPAFCDDEFMDLLPFNYAYLSTGTLPNKSGVFVLQNFPGGNNKPWKFRQYYAKFASGGAAFQLRVRLEYSPYTTLASSSGLTSVGSADELTYTDLEADASSTAGDIGFGYVAGGAAKQYLSYALGWRTDLTGGIAVNSMGLYSGKKLTELVDTYLPSQTDAQLRAFFQVIRRKHLDLGQQPRVILVLNMGMNDRTTTTAEAFKVSTVAFMSRIREVYSTIGGSEGELYFILMPSHRIAGPNKQTYEVDAEQLRLEEYSKVSDDLASIWSNTASINLSNLFTYEEAVLRGWYDSGGPAHLLYDATATLWQRALNTVFGV